MTGWDDSAGAGAASWRLCAGQSTTGSPTSAIAANTMTPVDTSDADLSRKSRLRSVSVENGNGVHDSPQRKVNAR